MLDPQVSRFWQAGLRSGLLDSQSLSACWNALPPKKRNAAEHLDRRLARQAVESGMLTLWQAQQLCLGRSKGFKIDRYVLLEMLAQGGMGRVYLATDTRLKRRVALKILGSDRVTKPRAIARFQREGLVGAQLQHENLVRIYDFGESSGHYYLVMEYIEGKTIADVITERGPMPPASAVRLIRQIAMGLAHIHSKGLIHRDVNPQNILVTPDGIAKLADLGLALDLDQTDRFTREGATLGTFDYLAPEQARDSHAADIRSDIYSLGCTLYHLITGQVPFPIASLPEKLLCHQTKEPAPLNQFVPDLSKGLAEVIARMMRKAPNKRYATPREVAQALQPFESASACIERDEEVLEISHKAVNGASSNRSSRSLDHAPQFAAQPAASLTESATAVAFVETLPAGGNRTEKPLDPARHAAESPMAPLTPVRAAGSTDPDFPVFVDLGPEPSLSTELSRTRSPFSHLLSATAGLAIPTPPLPETVTSTSNDSDRVPWWLSAWLWALIALVVLVMGSVAILAVVRGSGVKGTGRFEMQQAPVVAQFEEGGASATDGNRESA